MNELVKFMFGNIFNYLLTLLTLFIMLMMVLSAIRVVLETSIPKIFKECITAFFVAKHGAEHASRKLKEKENED